jgi:RecA-family ATPase
MPDGVDSQLDAQAGVVLLSAEDDPADTIRPRLEAAGADLSRIIMLAGLRDGDSVRLPTLTDLDAIKHAIAQVNAKLVIVDPLMAYLPGKVDSYRDQDVRRILAPLAALAAETGAAVLVIRHLNKTEGKNALYRGGGSIGIIGAARSGLLVAKDPEDEERRILAVTKSNLAKTPPALAYRIATTADEIPYLVWEGTTDYTAASLLA